MFLHLSDYLDLLLYGNVLMDGPVSKLIMMRIAGWETGFPPFFYGTFVNVWKTSTLKLMLHIRGWKTDQCKQSLARYQRWCRVTARLVVSVGRQASRNPPPYE